MATQPDGAGRLRLDALLDSRNEHPERIAAIDDVIRAEFAQTHAVLVLDMSGFSRLVARYGTTHYLAMIRRMQGTAAPLVVSHEGRVVKQEADNLFAVFPTVDAAVESSRAINRAFAVANRYLPEDWDIHVSIGIGYGDVLMVDDVDMFGHEMNLASKLGEDVAMAGEVLLTQSAYVALSTSEAATFNEATFGRFHVAYWRLERSDAVVPAEE
jgi:adenylate cyclase